MTTPRPDRIPMTRREVEALISVEAVLRRLGLSLYCVRCHARGDKDGVRSDNDPQGKELVVECGCCVRVYHRDSSPLPVTPPN